MPTVLLDRALDLPEGCGAAFANETDSIGLILTHLWELGHRRIAHIAGPIGDRASGAQRPAVSTALEWPDDVAVRRLDAYCEGTAMRNAFDSDLIAYAQAWSAPQAESMLARLFALSAPATAILCANDAQAVDICRAARTLGYRVPQDLSVAAVDDSLAARNNHPPITSVKVPTDEIGQQGVHALLQLFNGAPVTECRIAVPVTQLVVRKSTAPPR
jgi:DNA-binding LacI/PurR family transcriptional regulator